VLFQINPTANNSGMNYNRAKIASHGIVCGDRTDFTENRDDRHGASSYQIALTTTMKNP